MHVLYPKMHNLYLSKNDLSTSYYKNRKEATFRGKRKPSLATVKALNSSALLTFVYKTETIFSKITLFDPDIMSQHLSPRLPTGAIYFHFSNNFKYLDFLTGLEKTKRKTHPTKGETKTRLKF